MSLADRIAAKSRKPSATLFIGGRRWFGVLAISKREEFGQSVETVTVTGRNPPIVPTAGQALTFKWGYDGYEAQAFNGEVSRILRRSYPNIYTIEGRGILHRAQRVQQDISGGVAPYNNIPASDAIRYILETYAGITRHAIPALPASGSAWVGSEWMLGTLTPVRWERTTALAAIQEIGSVLGYWIYADVAGIVRALNIERRPVDVAFRTFQRGVDLLMSGPPEREINPDTIRNRVEVNGANTGIAGAQIRDARQTSHPLLPSGVYQTLTFSSSLIEYVNESEAGAASAERVAARILNVWSRDPNVLRATIKADPRIGVGTTIGIVDSAVGYSSARHFFVYASETTLDLQSGKFDQILTLDGGTGSQGYSTIPNPIAAFTWRIVTETLNGNSVVEVFLDGSGSTSPAGGAIISWAWSTATTTYGGTPNTASGQTALFLYAASSGPAEITLTVTDTTSKQGSMVQSVEFVGDALIVPESRVISIAFGAAWQITPNGGATWISEIGSGDAVAVPPFGPGVDPESTPTNYGLLATRASGATGIRESRDLLSTASQARAAIGSAITMIWQNERNAARVWIAVGSTVRRSLDGGATFTLWGTLPDPVAWIIEDPSVNNSVFVLSGNTLYHSTSSTAPGTDWAALFVGQPGKTGRHMVRSRDGAITWICYSDSNIVERVEGGSFTIAGAGGVRALALAPSGNRIYAFDDQRRIIWADADTGANQSTSAQIFPAGSTVQHALHDPDYPIIYVADFDSVASGTGAARKYFPDADQLLLFRAGATGQQAHMIGLGQRGRGGANIIQIPSGESGAADKLFVYSKQNGTWAAIAPPRPGWYWTSIRVDPFNTDRWLLMGNSSGSFGYRVVSGNVRDLGSGSYSPLWMTEDAGTSWAEVELSHPWATNDNTGNACLLYPFTLGWQQSQAGWYLYGSSNSSASAGRTHWIWRSNSTAASAPAYESGGEGSACCGRENDVIVTRIDGSFVRYWPGAGGASVAIGSVAASPSNLAIDVEPGGSRLATGYAFGTLFVSDNYRSGSISQRGDLNVGGCFQWATHGLYSARPNDPVRVDPATGATTGLGYSNRGSTSIAVDRQSRSVVAWRLNDGVYLIYDGETYQEIGPPPDMGTINDAMIETFTDIL